jgi:hypothetical protein
MQEARAGRGRPAKGLGLNGEPRRIRDYPRLRVTVRPLTRDRLIAIAARQGRPTWRVVEDSMNLYFDQLNTADRQALDTVLQAKENGLTEQ